MEHKKNVTLMRHESIGTEVLFGSIFVFGLINQIPCLAPPSDINSYIGISLFSIMIICCIRSLFIGRTCANEDKVKDANSKKNHDRIIKDHYHIIVVPFNNWKSVAAFVGGIFFIVYYSLSLSSAPLLPTAFAYSGGTLLFLSMAFFLVTKHSKLEPNKTYNTKNNWGKYINVYNAGTASKSMFSNAFCKSGWMSAVFTLFELVGIVTFSVTNAISLNKMASSKSTQMIVRDCFIGIFAISIISVTYTICRRFYTSKGGPPHNTDEKSHKDYCYACKINN